MGFFSSLVGAAVGFLIGGPVGAVIGAGLGATKVGEKVVNTVMDFVLQPFMPSIPDMGNSDAASQREQGVLIQRQGSTSQIPVVYGYRKVGTAVIVRLVDEGTAVSNGPEKNSVAVPPELLVQGATHMYTLVWFANLKKSPAANTFCVLPQFVSVHDVEPMATVALVRGTEEVCTPRALVLSLGSTISKLNCGPSACAR